MKKCIFLMSNIFSHLGMQIKTISWFCLTLFRMYKIKKETTINPVMLVGKMSTCY